MGPRLPLTPVVGDLPEMVPFIGPETFERRQGRKLRVRLGANESAFGISPAAREAMQAAVQDSWMYNDPEAYDLTEALSQAHGVAFEQVLVGAGIDELLGLLVRIFADRGEPVVMSNGSYPTFAYHTTGHGARLETVDYVDDQVDLVGLAVRVQETGARLVYVANPDNPMGGWRTAKQISDFVDAVGPECMIILDEAYADFAPQEAKGCVVTQPLALAPGNVIRTRTFSKAHGLAGARVGYLLADREIVDVLKKVRNQFGVNRIAQVGALASLADTDFVARVVDGVWSGREQLRQVADGLGLNCLASATNFVNIDVGGGARARQLLAYLIEADVFVRMPSSSPGDRCLRVTVGRPADHEIFAAALADAMTRVDPS
ncbi:MAG: aminotransferase class I/II-fold pyridoxal phosphate-dependent enzyme [Gemmatimonadetes bacterium]|jgi:histidinol-phosphate aminotransferase|nr:aminotransferase class I/II-fold pyridoxal phosphate-dependent enzyme [Gemmatimonadota bacterium]MBT5141475.1 aminotransferase class I/II-fold pyridoxal phosphate-dependent enzyme [Gemmatimonadota bacterium]MBT5590708.1 aminotransferase class I/II-fold pyridoxal phosphate-dependent enzyme [Gemmatimonadota bacterium]MBT5965157.1 aminotransferase class I/II-fold pyridoxal phosphate-dependent enzyme [Gemmatimonadota bacterium]MBT6625922.1 aminotransferase class I/II-fold pyridoxal phosphate-dep